MIAPAHLLRAFVRGGRMPDDPIAPALAGIAIVILVLVALVHVYWALGGRLGHGAAIPSTGTGPLFHPTSGATLGVAAILVAVAGLVAIRVGLLAIAAPAAPVRIACAVVALVFLARAIGDFRYVGFFKRRRASRFARLDTALYSPLCLFLALAIGLNAL